MESRAHDSKAKLKPLICQIEYPDHFRMDMEIHLVSKINEDLSVSAFQDGHFLTKALVMHMIEAMVGLNYKLMVSADINRKEVKN